MAEASTPSEDNQRSGATISMYRHVKCDDWGLASVDWERDGKRAYRFQDGTVRIFAERFYHLFEKVGEMEVSHARPKGKVAFTPNLDDQVKLFLERYPDGFAGEAYAKKHRGGKGRHLKRHRVPSIAAAKEQLSAEALDTLIAEGRFEGVRDAVIAVLEATDLATKSHLDALRRIVPTEGAARGIREFIHGTDDDAARFANLRRELGHAGLKSPAWNLITGMRALVHEHEHVCVRPSSFDAQGDLVRRTFKTNKKPNSSDYNKYLEVARQVRDGLRDRGYPPEDMFDVYDFICATMRPAEREALDALAATRHEAEMRAKAAKVAEDAAAEKSTAANATDTTTSADAPSSDDTVH